MTKDAFLLSLQDKLSCLPREEVFERLNFYSEMIDDRMEEGLSEEEAVAQVGNADEIAAQIVTEISVPAEKKTAKKQRSVWEIVLLVLGAPLWISLLAAAFSVFVSLWASLWSVIVAFWAVFVSLAAFAFGCAVGGVICAVSGKGLLSGGCIAASFVCAGLAIFAFFGCKAATKGAAWLTKKSVLWIMKQFRKKEGA